MTKELEFIRKKCGLDQKVMILCSHCKGYGFIDTEDNECLDYMGYSTVLDSEPITLGRILRAIIQGERSLVTATPDLKALINIIYDWDYDQLTLQRQSPETILAISKLLGYEK